MPDPVEFPARVLLVTAGVDCQERYVISLTIGWTPQGEAFVGEYFQTHVPTRDGGARVALEALQETRYALRGGSSVPVSLVGVDSGFASDHVVAAVRGRRGVFATKGVGGRGEGDPIVLPSHDKRADRHTFHPLLINTDHAKAELMAALTVKEGARAWHIHKRLGRAFVDSLTAEAPVPKYDADGVEVGVVWKLRKSTLRNEAMDCGVINLALFSTVTRRDWYRVVVARVRSRPGNANRVDDGLFEEAAEEYRQHFPGEALPVRRPRKLISFQFPQWGGGAWY